MANNSQRPNLGVIHGGRERWRRDTPTRPAQLHAVGGETLRLAAVTPQPFIEEVHVSPEQKQKVLGELIAVTRVLANSQARLLSSGNMDAIKLHQGLTELTRLMGVFDGDIDRYVESRRTKYMTQPRPRAEAEITVANSGLTLLKDALMFGVDGGETEALDHFSALYRSPTWTNVPENREAILIPATQAAFDTMMASTINSSPIGSSGGVLIAFQQMTEMVGDISAGGHRSRDSLDKIFEGAWKECMTPIPGPAAPAS